MASVIFEEQVEIPSVGSLTEFRVWALSDDFPERGRIDYIAGRIEVDMSPEEVFVHGTAKTEIVRAFAEMVKRRGGYVLSDTSRISSPEADLSVEPDVVFLSDESLDSGRVRLVPKASGEPDRYVELEGAPDLIVEIVSDSSVKKDTKRLPGAYWQAGVPEFWLVDARVEPLVFHIHHSGPDGYITAAPDAQGFQYSRVLDAWFFLERRRNRRGRLVFDLIVRPGAG